MAIRFSIKAGANRPATGAANVVLRAGVCTAGVANGRYQMDPGQDPTPTVGYGPLSAAAAQGSRLGGAPQILLKVPATLAGTIGSVSETPAGPGPTPTIAGSSFDSVTNSPYDAFKLRMKVLTPGPVGRARIGLNLDGGLSYPYTYDIPPEAPATLDGTVDLTGITLSTLNATNLIFISNAGPATLDGTVDLTGITLSTLNATTLVFAADAGGTQTVTFTTPSSVQDIADQINAGSTNVTASIIASKYLRISSDTPGTASSLAIDAPTSTGEAILGFSSGAGNISETGGRQKIVFTTPSSVADIAAQINARAIGMIASIIQGKYLRLVSTTAGTTSTLTVDAASTGEAILGFSSGAGNLTATGSASKLALPGTGLEVTWPATSDYVINTIYGSDTTAPRHSQADLDTALAAANADLSLAWGVTEVVQEPVDAPDLRAYVNDLDALFASMEGQDDKRFGVWIIGAPLDETDANIKTSMNGHVSRYGSAAVGDIYQTETTPLPKGDMRRSLCRPLGIRLAAQRLSEDPGVEPSLPLCSMVAPDGVTLARNDNTAAQKMGGSQGPGFTVAKSKAGLPYIKRGVTRAGANSVFVDLGVARMTAYASTIIFDRLRTLENRDYDLMPDGTLQESDAAALEDAFTGELERLLVQGKHASAVVVSVDRTEKISSTRNVTVTWTVQTRGQGEDITGTLNLTGELVIDGTKAA